MSEWQTSQKEAAAFNSKAMSAIFNVVSMEEFKKEVVRELEAIMGLWQ